MIAEESVVDTTTPQFVDAVAREVARLLRQAEENPIIDAPLGAIDIASRVDQPLGNQPSSANPVDRVNPSSNRPLSPVVSELGSISVGRQSNEEFSEGGNPRKNFSSEADVEVVYDRYRRESDAQFARFQADSQTRRFRYDEDELDRHGMRDNRFNYRDDGVSSDNKTVKRSLYQKISSVIIAELQKCEISSTTADKAYRLRQAQAVLNTTGLLTLIQGHRKEPKPSVTNKHGYSERSIIYVDKDSSQSSSPAMSRSSSSTTKIILEEDDEFHYIYDNERLYTLVHTMFAKHYHHNVSINTQMNKDGLQAYREITAIVFGQKQQDVKIARRALDQFQINPSVLLREQYSKWESLFSNLEYAQERELQDIEKMAWLSDRLDHDPRPKISASFAACAVQNMNYEETVSTIIRIADSLTPDLAVIKIASMYSDYPETPSNIGYQQYQSAQLNQYQHLSGNQNPPQSINSGQSNNNNQNRYNHDVNRQGGIQDARNYVDNNNKKQIKNQGYCFAFQKGTCQRSNCKYIHEFNPDKVNKNQNQN